MLQFKKKSNVIPIEFEDFKLEFEANDDNFVKLNELGDKIRVKAEEISETNDASLVRIIKNMLEEAFDTIFGNGTFEKVYEFSGRSSINTLMYFLQIVDGIVAEYNSQGDKDILNKYLSE